MPELTQQQIDDMQANLRLMMGHSSNENVRTADVATTDNPDKPLVSKGFFICTGMVLLYHNKDGQVEPSLLHLSTPHLGGPIRGFLNGLKQRMENDGGRVEAVFITGGRSTGNEGYRLDPDAKDMQRAITSIIPEDKITFHDTIKNPAAEAFGVAYVPPKHNAEGMVCVRDYGTDYITPHFPFESLGKDVAPAPNKGEGQERT